MFTYDLHGIVFLILYLLIISVEVFLLKSKGKANYYNIILSSMTSMYILLLVKVVILPITVGAEEVIGIPFDFKRCLQLIPFNTIRKAVQYGNWIQIIGNFLLLMPLPILICMIRQSQTKKKLIFAVMSSSIGIEGIQLLINLVTRYDNHVADVDDIILNIIGGTVIVIFVKPICRIIKKILE